MEKKLSNTWDIDLPIAVWLVHDNYDYEPRPNVISVTTLLKSYRQIILGFRGSSDKTTDVNAFIPSRKGTAYHDSIENSWLNQNYVESMKKLGYPQKVIDKIVVNPEGEVEPDQIPVYFEQRSERKIGNWIVSGKFDISFNWQVQDVKSTGTFKYIKKDFDDYRRQMSLYRWLAPNYIKEDVGIIHMIFTDWSRLESIRQKNYPKKSIEKVSIELTPEARVETFVQTKLKEIDRLKDLPEKDLPYCTPKELWQDAPAWKYYANADSKRASKVFENQHEAALFMGTKGKGIIKEVVAKPKRCEYCEVSGSCSQYASYVQRGLI